MHRAVPFLIVTLFISLHAWAYPDFISYGYTTCVTCHFNTEGNGPLTDYGRAIFSQEIAARNPWADPKVSDEEIADGSGFIPGTELPSWIRPSVKFRGLQVQSNPGSSNKASRTIQMQRDVNLTFVLSDDQKTILSFNYGLLPMPMDYYGKGTDVSGVSREHYFRFYVDRLAITLGLTDKVYGLRTGDHTSFARGALGLGQNDQVHGLIAHWFEKTWDIAFHFYAGNQMEESVNRDKGISMLFESTAFEKDRWGFSAMSESIAAGGLKSTKMALHNRWGFAPGSDLLVEVGLNQHSSTGSDPQTATYGLLQSVVRLKRGYNIITAAERAQSESRFSAPELQRWTLGFLMFPLQRTEIRVTTVQTKTFSPTSGTMDGTQLQGQVHVSF